MRVFYVYVHRLHFPYITHTMTRPAIQIHIPTHFEYREARLNFEVLPWNNSLTN